MLVEFNRRTVARIEAERLEKEIHEDVRTEAKRLEVAKYEAVKHEADKLAIESEQVSTTMIQTNRLEDIGTTKVEAESMENVTVEADRLQTTEQIEPVINESFKHVSQKIETKIDSEKIETENVKTQFSFLIEKLYVSALKIFFDSYNNGLMSIVFYLSIILATILLFKYTFCGKKYKPLEFKLLINVEPTVSS